MPGNGSVSKILRLGALPVGFFGGARYWAVSPDFGPENRRARPGMTVLPPRPGGRTVSLRRRRL